MSIQENEPNEESKQEAAQDEVAQIVADGNHTETAQDEAFETIDSIQKAPSPTLELETIKEQSQLNLDKALRAQAELENIKKRATRDIENAHRYALEKFVNELLPIIDSLELGIDAAKTAEKTDDLKEGMDLTLKMFNTAVEKFGVQALMPEGQKFNPEQHEAVSMQAVEDTESGTVVRVMQKGYELNGRLVRPAMVVVAK